MAYLNVSVANMVNFAVDFMVDLMVYSINELMVGAYL